MIYFVTGGTGFIGRHLINKLISDDHEVHALCRSEVKASQLPSKTRIFIGSLDDRKTIQEAMHGCDYVLHLAAFAKVWAKNSRTFYDINVVATNLILEIAKEQAVKKVVVVSTGGVYGPSLDGIVSEDFVRKMDFNNEYEGSKALSESWIKDFALEGLDVVIVSPTRVYGPYLSGPSESVSLMVEKYVKGSWRILPGPADKIGNYVFVEDVVQGMLLALERGKKGRTYILGGENHSYKGFFEVLARVSGIKRKMFPLPISVSYIFAALQLFMAKVFGKDPLITPKWVGKAKYHWTVSSKRAETELGYKITSLEDGLTKMVNELNR